MAILSELRETPGVIRCFCLRTKDRERGRNVLPKAAIKPCHPLSAIKSTTFTFFPQLHINHFVESQNPRNVLNSYSLGTLMDHLNARLHHWASSYWLGPLRCAPTRQGKRQNGRIFNMDKSWAWPRKRPVTCVFSPTYEERTWKYSQYSYTGRGFIVRPGRRHQDPLRSASTGRWQPRDVLTRDQRRTEHAVPSTRHIQPPNIIACSSRKRGDGRMELAVAGWTHE